MRASPDRYDRRQKAKDYSESDVSEICLNVFKKTPDEIKLLSGGFSNANFLVIMEGRKYVARFYPDGIGPAQREIAILKLAAARGVRVPRVVEGPVKAPSGKVVIFLEFVGGLLLSDLLSCNDLDLAPILHETGRQLGHIHSVRFDQAGLIGWDGKVSCPFKDLAAVGLEFIEKPLQGRAGKRLDPEICEQVKNLIKDKWHWTADHYNGPVLVHCDFNPKNLMVDLGKQEVTVLDWEFSIAADPLIDLGNFVRFEEDYSSPLVSEFIQGYEQIRGPLPRQWQLTAKLHDLVSMFSFLDSEEEMPKTFHTAKTVVARTLAAFKELA